MIFVRERGLRNNINFIREIPIKLVLVVGYYSKKMLSTVHVAHAVLISIKLYEFLCNILIAPITSREMHFDALHCASCLYSELAEFSFYFLFLFCFFLLPNNKEGTT